MITYKELSKQIKIITQNAWRQETNTTVNSIVEYIVRESLETIVEALIEHAERIAVLEQSLEKFKEGNKDGKDGRVSQPQRNSKSTNATSTGHGSKE